MILRIASSELPGYLMTFSPHGRPCVAVLIHVSGTGAPRKRDLAPLDTQGRRYERNGSADLAGHGVGDIPLRLRPVPFSHDSPNNGRLSGIADTRGEISESGGTAGGFGGRIIRKGTDPGGGNDWRHYQSEP